MTSLIFLPAYSLTVFGAFAAVLSAIVLVGVAGAGVFDFALGIIVLQKIKFGNCDVQSLGVLVIARNVNLANFQFRLANSRGTPSVLFYPVRYNR